MQIAYTGTVTGLRISAVDGGATASGGAFVDGANASITALADGNHEISIYDSAGRALKGVLKAAGSAETLDSNLVVNGTDWTGASGATPPNSWTDVTAGAGHYDIVGGTLKLLNFLNNPQINQALTITANGLYKYQASLKNFDFGYGVNFNLGTASAWNASAFDLFQEIESGTADFVVHTKYFVTNLTTVYIGSNGSASAGTQYGFVDTVSAAQVLTPSTSGSTIVSAKGGVTYNWSLQTSGFLFNEASYAVTVRRLR